MTHADGTMGRRCSKRQQAAATTEATHEQRQKVTLKRAHARELRSRWCRSLLDHRRHSAVVAVAAIHELGHQHVARVAAL